MFAVTPDTLTLLVENSEVTRSSYGGENLTTRLRNKIKRAKTKSLECLFYFCMPKIIYLLLAHHKNDKR